MRKSQIKLGIMLSYLSRAIRLLSGIIYTPIMIRLLGQNEFGIYNIAASLIAYLGILNFGFGSAYLRYYSIYKSREDKVQEVSNLNGMFFVIFSILGTIAVISGLIMVSQSDLIFGMGLSDKELTKAKVIMIILVFNLAFSFPNIVFSTYIQANEKFLFFYLLDILKQVTTPLINLPILLSGKGAVGMVLGSLFVNIVIELISIYYCFSRLNMKIKFDRFDKSLFTEMSVYSFYIFINLIVDQINNNVDKTILGRFQGSASVAIYSVGNNLKLYFQEISTTIANVFTPRIHKLVSKGASDKELTKLFIKIGRIQFIILSMVLIGFIFWGRRFVSIWVGTNYDNAYFVALILMSTVLLSLIQNVGIEIQRAKNLHKFRSWLYLFMALGNIILSIPFAKRYGEIGTTIATGLSFIIGNGLILNVYYHNVVGLNIKLFFKEIISILPSYILPVFFGVFVWQQNFESIIFYVLSGIIFGIIFCISVWNFALNEEEKSMLSFINRRKSN